MNWFINLCNTLERTIIIPAILALSSFITIYLCLHSKLEDLYKFGGFISGVGTVLIAIGGYFTFSNWQKEKRFDLGVKKGDEFFKSSEQLNVELNKLYISLEENDIKSLKAIMIKINTIIFRMAYSASLITKISKNKNFDALMKLSNKYERLNDRIKEIDVYTLVNDKISIKSDINELTVAYFDCNKQMINLTFENIKL